MSTATQRSPHSFSPGRDILLQTNGTTTRNPLMAQQKFGRTTSRNGADE